MLLPKAPKLGMHWNGQGTRLVLALVMMLVMLVMIVMVCNPAPL